MPKQPNIVFIMADQLGAAAMKCYGGRIASTPTLDALAARGIRFDRCYAIIPACAPSRASFLTGRSPVIHGNTQNNYNLPNDQPTYAHVLKAHGYRTGGFGKFHTSPMHLPRPQIAHLGFDESVVADDTKWEWYEWVCREHPEHKDLAVAMSWPFWPMHPPHPDSPKSWPMRAKLLDPIYSKEPWPQIYPSPLPHEVHDSTFITNVGLDFMKRHLAEHADQPFFCHISYVDPHDPYDPPEPYASMFKAEDMPPALPAEWVKDDIKILRESNKFLNFDPIWDKPEAIAKWRAYYHGSLRFLDDQIKRVVDFLDASGQWDNTIIVFTTDHGEMLGDHGLHTKGVKHYDMSARCPLIVAGGRVPAGQVSDRLTSTLDFFPTFCEWAGVPACDLPPLEGRSFMDGKSWPEVAVQCGDVVTVITEDRWRMTRYLGENKGQLFDLNTDPGEQHNLYNDPAHVAKRLELLERMILANERPRLTPQYRNLPVVDGERRPITLAVFDPPFPNYELPPSPDS